MKNSHFSQTVLEMFMYPIQIHAYLWHYLVHRSLFSGEMDIKTQTSNSLSLSHSECKTKFKLNDAERMNKSLPNTNRNHLWILQIAISKVKRMNFGSKTLDQAREQERRLRQRHGSCSVCFSVQSKYWWKKRKLFSIFIELLISDGAPISTAFFQCIL